MEKKDLEAITAATEAGVQRAIGNPDTWKLGFAAMQEALTELAQRGSGKWFVDWIGWLFKKALLGLAVLIVLYYTGGLPAVMAWLKLK